MTDEEIKECRRKTEETYRSMTPDEYLSKDPRQAKNLKRERRANKIKRFFCILFGIGSSEPKIHSAYNTTLNSQPQQSSNSGSSFKEQYQFNPEQAYLQRVQERAYMQMVDGKGDHDCHCK